MAKDFYTKQQQDDIRGVTMTMYLSERETHGLTYKEAWTRAVELLGLPKPPAAEPVLAPALDLDRADIDVILMALAGAHADWEKAETEHDAKSVQNVFADLKTRAFDLHIRVSTHAKRLVKFAVKPASADVDAVESAIVDMARFFVVSYGQMHVPGLTELWDRAGITIHDRQNLSRLIGRSISTSTLSPEHKVMIARLYLAAYQDLNGMEFRKIVKTADLITERYHELFKAAKTLVGEGAYGPQD